MFIFVDTNTVRLIAQDFFENLSEILHFNWNLFFLICNTTLDNANIHMLQYKYVTVITQIYPVE